MDTLKKVYWILSAQFGCDIRRLSRSIRGLPRYIRDAVNFYKKYNGQFNIMPCLSDWYEEGGDTNSEYFRQDLYVAQKIKLSGPKRHVDIGSRVDGFVAHVASYRDIEVFDIRPIDSQIPGIMFFQADLMKPPERFLEYCDSISCLHALEHFGLGRYGDPIDPHGYVAGLRNIASMLQRSGTFYLSVPIGKERVEFNAHRVFDPCLLVKLAVANQLRLKEFAWINSTGVLVESVNPEQDISNLRKQHYSLGIFSFIKEAEVNC